MLITNTTKWDTNDLRKLFGRCINDVRKYEGEGRNRGIKISVKNDKVQKMSMRGNAWVGYYGMMLKIGIDIDMGFNREMSIEHRRELAHLFTHEYYHNLGYKGQDYRNYKADWTAKFDYDFVKDYKIGKEEIRIQPKKDIQMERYQKTLKYVKEYDIKMRRIKNLFKKWKQKEKYYERILTASGKINKS